MRQLFSFQEKSCDGINKDAQAVFSEMYAKQAQSEQAKGAGANGAEAGGKSEDKVVDAEVEEKKEDKK